MSEPCSCPNTGCSICFCNSSVLIELPGLSLINHVATTSPSGVFAYSKLFQTLPVSSSFIKSSLKMTTVKANLCYYRTEGEKKEGRGGKSPLTTTFSLFPEEPPPNTGSVFVSLIVEPEPWLFKVALTFKEHFPGCYCLSRDHWKKFGIGSIPQCPEINELIPACKVFLEPG